MVSFKLGLEATHVSRKAPSRTPATPEKGNEWPRHHWHQPLYSQPAGSRLGIFPALIVLIGQSGDSNTIC